MSNLAATENGHADTGASWRSWYEDPDFRQNLEDTWSGKPGRRGVRDLYGKLHGYIRYVGLTNQDCYVGLHK